MKKFGWKLAPFIIVVIVFAAALAPVVHGQSLGTTVRVSAVPDGPVFSVDGMNYQHAMTAVWPTGSKHMLAVDSSVQGRSDKSRFTFQSWSAGTMTLPGGNYVTITADPSIQEVQARFQAEYALSLNFNSCGEANYCSAPGKIFIGQTAYTANEDIYMGPGATVTLMAVPNPGFVFTGWVPGVGQDIKGPLNTVTLNQPVTVYPIFNVARKVNLEAVPPGLLVLADRAPVPTPATMEWGWNSTHSVGPVSPQMDNQGLWWVFSSWSDGGAATHAYKVPQSNTADTLTATYVRGTAMAFTTSPPGLKLSIDGRDNWPAYNFIWGGGETHHVQAPARQTDARGRAYTFASWSNGAPAAQDITVPADAFDSGIRFVATYSPVGRLLVNSSVAGVTVKVDGVDCATPCEVERPVGATVRVSAPASVPLGDSSRGDFMGWPGSGSANAEWSYTLGADPLTVSTDYRLMNRLAAGANPPEGASWSIQPFSPDGYYDSQAMVNVSVTALAGFRFHSWSGDLSGNKPSGVVAMNAPRAVRAQFDRVPYIAPAGVVNGAGSTPQAGIAPGSIVSIFGASLAPATTIGPATPLAQTLGGATVRLGDRFLPLFFVSPAQINVQLPDDVPGGLQVVRVSAEGLPEVQAAVAVVRNAPGLFQQVVKDQSFALAFHEDGSPVTTDAPARRGELLTVYGTGFGPTDHARPAGFAIPQSPAFLMVDPASVLIGDAAPVEAKAFAAAGRVAVDAVQFRLGDDAPSAANAALVVRINGQDSNTVLLPVE